jgi:hypothetical protein
MPPVRVVTIASVLTIAFLAAPAARVPPQAPGAPAPPPAADARPALSPRNASYAITARLDPASRTITGDEILTWRNVSGVPATTLRFHLYYNAWRNSASTWMRERRLAGNAALAARPARDWGWTEITSLRRIGTDQPVDLTNRLRFIAPDDGNEDDRTVVELPLETPVAPGGTINLQIAWSARVPRPFARTGAIGDFYFVAQWFPKIGVLEADGWNCHQFHAATEFFADFGVYDVRLTVPRGWIVGATGEERGRREEADGTVTHQYYAADVHDFAWTASPSYVERTATFEHPVLPTVAIRLLLQPEHVGQADRHIAAAQAALRYYGEWFGPYPYPTLTVVDPAWQSGAGGMEYPTLITAGTRWIAPPGAAQPESVTIHEAGHQFWYGVVATNEFEHAWMDEGFTTFSTARVLAQTGLPNAYVQRYFGGFIPWVFDDVRLTREVDGNRMAGYRRAPHADVPATPTWRYWPGTAGVITYNKTALWLHTLERLVGWDTLQHILSTYYSRYAFRHPSPDDFFSTASEVAGRDLTWFFDAVVNSSAAFDYEVARFTSSRVEVRGFTGEGSERRVVDRTPSAPYRTTVLVRRLQDGIFPVDVRVVLEDGEEVRWHWSGAERWKLFEIDRPVRARLAEVDPDRVLLLDLNVTNNSAHLTAAAGRTAARRWSLAWLVWLQDQLLTYGFFV